MRIINTLKSLLLGTVFAIPMGLAARAADLVLYSPEPMAQQNHDLVLPAVSGINGKIELSGGWLRIPPDDYGHVRLNGSLSMPVGDRFGLQGDLGVYNTPSGVGVSGALHAFTRDPDQYLLGITAGFVRVPGATLVAIGPEAELYMGDFTLEAWAGFAHLGQGHAGAGQIGAEIDEGCDVGWFGFSCGCDGVTACGMADEDGRAGEGAQDGAGAGIKGGLGGGGRVVCASGQV